MACAPDPVGADASSQPTQAEPCWCTRVQFSAHLLQQVPEAAKNKACICMRCATMAHTATTSSGKD
ncbi:MAG: cysteine-rich CWC family protein [Limnohabitans sp.]